MAAEFNSNQLLTLSDVSLPEISELVLPSLPMKLFTASCHYDLILGSDVLSQFKNNIDFNNQLISGPDSHTVQLRQFPNAADLSPTNIGIYLAMDHFETTITDIMMTTHWSQNHNHSVRLVVSMGSATVPLVTLGCWMSVQQLLHPTM